MLYCQVFQTSRAWFPVIRKRNLFCLSHFRVDKELPCMTLIDNWSCFSEWTINYDWIIKRTTFERVLSQCLFYLVTSKFISIYVNPIAAITRLLVYITSEAKIIQITEVIMKATHSQLWLIFFSGYIFSTLKGYTRTHIENVSCKFPDTYTEHVCVIVLGMAAYVV